MSTDQARCTVGCAIDASDGMWRADREHLDVREQVTEEMRSEPREDGKQVREQGEQSSNRAERA